MMLREVNYNGGGGGGALVTCLFHYLHMSAVVLHLVWDILYVQQQLLVLTDFHLVYC